MKALLALLLMTAAASAAPPVASPMVGNTTMTVGCDTAEQVDSIIAAWQGSMEAGLETLSGLMHVPSIYPDEMACMVGESRDVRIVAVEARGGIPVNDGVIDVWRVEVQQARANGAGIAFFLLWTAEDAITYGETM